MTHLYTRMVFSFTARTFKKLKWVFSVYLLSADLSSRAKLLLGGIYLTVFDYRQTRISFCAKLRCNEKCVSIFINNIEDYGLIYEIFILNVYRISCSNIPEVIVDLGSNIGISSLYYHTLYPEALIISVEPDPNNFNRLKSNTDGIPTIHALNYAVTGKHGAISFYIDPHRGSSSSVMIRRSRQVEYKVESRPLSSIIKSIGVDKVDILKFDIEGSEECIFRDNINWNNVKNIAGEIHVDLLDSASSIFDTLDKNFKYTKNRIDNNRFIVKGKIRIN